MRNAKTTIGWLCYACVLMTSCGSLPSSEQVEKWKEQTDRTLGTVSLGVEKAREIATAAAAKVESLRADVDKAAEELEAKGAPVDGSASDLLAWAASNPVTAAGSGGSLLTLLAALALGYKRAKKAVSVMARGIESIPDPAVSEIVKEAIAARGGKAPEINAQIQSALST